MPALIRDATLLDPEAGEATSASLVVDDGRIAARIPMGQPLPDDLAPHPLSGCRIAPGLIDLHFHGQLVYARESELGAVLRETSLALAATGVTSFLATTVAWSSDRVNEFMTQTEQAMTQGGWPGAEPLGVHLEGPWINADAAGAQPRSVIRPFGSGADRQVIDRYGEFIRMVTFAPECEGAGALLDELTRRRIVASLGHSHAPRDAIDAAAVRGMTHVTHLFNAMGPIHHREPGVAVWVLGDGRLTCDLICDGVHVHPTIAAGAARALGERLILITDRIAPTQADSFGSGQVVDDGCALRLADGRLAGSSLSMDRAVRNARELAHLGEIEAIAAATLRPARALGIESMRGTLRTGARADFAVFDDAGRIEQTWVAGRRVHPAG